MTCHSFSHGLSEANRICERARGAPHEHKLQASYFMGSTLGFVKMQCPQLAGAQTQGRCIACLLFPTETLKPRNQGSVGNTIWNQIVGSSQKERHRLIRQ